MSKRLTKSFIIYGLGAGLSQSVTLLLIKVFTTHFDKSTYGQLELLQSGFILISLFGILQLESAAGRYYYEYPTKESKKGLISELLLTVSLLSLSTVILLLLILAGLNYFSFDWYNTFLKTYNPSILILILSIPFYNLYNYLMVILRFQNKAVSYGLLSLLQGSLSVGISLFVIFKTPFTKEGYFMGQAVAYLITAIILIFIFRSFIVIKFNKLSLRKYFKYSLPQTPAVVVSWAGGHANRFLMASFLAPALVGIYIAAIKVASIFKLMETAFRMAWTPYFTERSLVEGHQAEFRKIFYWVSGLVLLSVVLFILFDSFLIDLLISKAYGEARTIIGFLGVAVSLEVLSTLVCVGPSLSQKTIYNTYRTVAGLAANFITFILLVPTLQIKGVALSLLIGNIVLFLSSSWFSEKLYPVGFITKYYLIIFLIVCGLLILLLY